MNKLLDFRFGSKRDDLTQEISFTNIGEFKNLSDRLVCEKLAQNTQSIEADGALKSLQKLSRCGKNDLKSSSNVV